MAIVDDLLLEELTEAGVPPEQCQEIVRLAAMGTMGLLATTAEIHAAWQRTGLDTAHQREIMHRVKQQALIHLEGSG